MLSPCVQGPPGVAGTGSSAVPTSFPSPNPSIPLRGRTRDSRDPVPVQVGRGGHRRRGHRGCSHGYGQPGRSRVPSPLLSLAGPWGHWGLEVNCHFSGRCNSHPNRRKACSQGGEVLRGAAGTGRRLEGSPQRLQVGSVLCLLGEAVQEPTPLSPRALRPDAGSWLQAQETLGTQATALPGAPPPWLPQVAAWHCSQVTHHTRPGPLAYLERWSLRGRG